jgi:hypothetical protein
LTEKKKLVGIKVILTGKKVKVGTKVILTEIAGKFLQVPAKVILTGLFSHFACPVRRAEFRPVRWSSAGFSRGLR